MVVPQLVFPEGCFVWVFSNGDGGGSKVAMF